MEGPKAKPLKFNLPGVVHGLLSSALIRQCLPSAACGAITMESLRLRYAMTRCSCENAEPSVNFPKIKFILQLLWKLGLFIPFAGTYKSALVPLVSRLKEK